MKKIFLAVILAVLVSAVFLAGCGTGEAAELSPEVIAELNAELDAKLEQLTPEEKELILGEDQALVGMAYYARMSIARSSLRGSCRCTKLGCGNCCNWDCS